MCMEISFRFVIPRWYSALDWYFPLGLSLGSYKWNWILRMHEIVPLVPVSFFIFQGNIHDTTRFRILPKYLQVLQPGPLAPIDMVHLWYAQTVHLTMQFLPDSLHERFSGLTNSYYTSYNQTKNWGLDVKVILIILVIFKVMSCLPVLVIK